MLPCCALNAVFSLMVVVVLLGRHGIYDGGILLSAMAVLLRYLSRRR